MYPTLLDTKTGKVVVAKDFDSSIFWWAEGNGSCDCNRSIVIDGDSEEVYNELEQEFGENRCFGCTRIIALDVHGDLEGMTKEEIIQDLNREYPEELIEQFKDRINVQQT